MKPVSTSLHSTSLYHNNKLLMLEKLKNCALQLDKNQLQKCDAYIEDLVRWNAKINLVGTSTLTEPYTRHILDALQLVQHLPIGVNPLNILDIGSGAGIPSVPLSIETTHNIFACEIITKKSNFINSIKRKLVLNNLEVLNTDVQTLYEHPSAPFDVITARAFADLNKLFEMTQKIIHENTVFVLLKGKNISAEIDAINKKFVMTTRIEKSIVDSEGCVVIMSPVPREAC